MSIADIVARALVEACRRMQTDPFEVASGAKDGKLSRTYPISMSRAYAALALVEVVPELSCRSIAVAVGASSPDSYLSTLLRRIEFKECPWHNETIAAEIREAVMAEAEMSGR